VEKVADETSDEPRRRIVEGGCRRDWGGDRHLYSRKPSHRRTHGGKSAAVVRFLGSLACCGNVYVTHQEAERPYCALVICWELGEPFLSSTINRYHSLTNIRAPIACRGLVSFITYHACIVVLRRVFTWSGYFKWQITLCSLLGDCVRLLVFLLGWLLGSVGLRLLTVHSEFIR